GGQWNRMADRIDNAYRGPPFRCCLPSRLDFLGHRTRRTKSAAVTAPFAVARKTRPAAEGGNHGGKAEMSGDRAGGALLGQRIGGAVRRRRGRARSANAQTTLRSRRVALERDG